MIKKLVFILLATVFAINANAQNVSVDFEARYNAAKQLLDQGQYGLAMQSFKQLLSTEDKNDIIPFAQFYLGYSAYYAGDISFAKDTFLQLTVKYTSWEKIDGAYLWLSKIGFEQSGLFKGMFYASEIKTEPYLSKSNLFIKTQLKDKPLGVLASLLAEYPTNKIIAKLYAIALSNELISFENSALLDSLITKFSFDSEQFNTVPQSVHKGNYNIGVLLPLFIDRTEASGKYLKKSLAIDIYEGAKMAINDVDSSLFTLKVFDTKKDSSQLSILFNKGALSDIDVVLGPIYPNPVEKMKLLAQENKLNFVNPTSTSPQIPESSPFAFISRASASQLAQKSAEYMKQQPVNKNVIVYYGTNDVDSIAAFEYKRSMEADSFYIISIIKISKENRREVYDGLTASKTVLDYEKISKMSEEDLQRVMQLPTTDSLLIQPDSIGHIFIASGDPTVSTEVMSAIISRGDSIKMMGVGNWFESDNAGLGIMEGLGVCLSIPVFDDVSTDEYRRLTLSYIEKYKEKPNKYFFRGYYGMKFIAESLKRYGTYFQNGYRKEGNINSSMDFWESNSNGAVIIVKMVDNMIQNVSPTLNMN